MITPVPAINNQPIEAPLAIQQEQNPANWYGRVVNQHTVNILDKIVKVAGLFSMMCVFLSWTNLKTDDNFSTARAWMTVSTSILALCGSLFQLKLIIKTQLMEDQAAHVN